MHGHCDSKSFIAHQTLLFVIVTLRRTPTQQDLGRARTAGNRFARDDQKPGPPQLEAKQLSEKRPRETTES
jgi:hypothetical protein